MFSPTEPDKYDSLCPVQSKIHCIFESKVEAVPSNKRRGQNYKVVASEILSKHAVNIDKLSKHVTEKIDGTCCYVQNNEEKSCLFARFDRKPTKPVEKKLKQFFAKYNRWERDGKEGEEPTFELNHKTDLKSVPEAWMPAKLVKLDEENCPIPDRNGHTPGWVPISTDTKQYCWHHTVVEQERLLVVRKCSHKDEEVSLEIVDVPFCDLHDKTFELVGTSINANPYGLGSKEQPFHFLVQHGAISIDLPHDDIEYNLLKSWFRSDACKVEGLVWHCSNGKMFKLHRHHMDLKWPLPDKSCSSLSQKSIVVKMQPNNIAHPSKLFEDLRNVNGQKFSTLHQLSTSLSVRKKDFTIAE